MKTNVRCALFAALLLSLAVAVLGARTRPMMVTAAPGRKTLAEASHIYVQHDWQKPSDDSLSTGSTQLQQPLLDDAWKHFKEDQDSSVKIQMLCDEQNPNMCPGNK